LIVTRLRPKVRRTRKKKDVLPEFGLCWPTNLKEKIKEGEKGLRQETKEPIYVKKRAAAGRSAIRVGAFRCVREA